MTNKYTITQLTLIDQPNDIAKIGIIAYPNGNNTYFINYTGSDTNVKLDKAIDDNVTVYSSDVLSNVVDFSTNFRTATGTYTDLPYFYDLSKNMHVEPLDGYTGQQLYSTATQCSKSITYDIFGNYYLVGNNIVLQKIGTIKFEYVIDTTTLTVNKSGEGTIYVNDTEITTPYSGTFSANDPVQLQAVPSNGYVFQNWQGASTSTNNKISINMNTDKTITAIFKKSSTITTFNVNISSNSGGYFSVNNVMYPTGAYSNSLQSGTTLSVKAIPNAGYNFKNWSGSIQTTEETINISLNTNITLIANFEKQSQQEISGMSWKVLPGSYDGTGAPLAGEGKKILVTFNIPYQAGETLYIGKLNKLFELLFNVTYKAYIDTVSITYDD